MSGEMGEWYRANVRAENLKMARAIWRRIYGRMTMNAGTVVRTEDYVGHEVAVARYQSYTVALDDIVRATGFTQEELCEASDE